MAIVTGDLKGNTTTLIGIFLEEFRTQEPLPNIDSDGNKLFLITGSGGDNGQG